MLLKRNNIFYLFIFFFILIFFVLLCYIIQSNQCYKKTNSFVIFFKLGFKCEFANSITLGEKIFLSKHHFSDFFRHRSGYNKNNYPCGTDKKIILLLGQSNAANNVKSYEYDKFKNFNLYNGKCFLLSSPVLGSTGVKKNISLAISNYLENENYIFLTHAWSGSSILDWGSDKYSYLTNYTVQQIEMSIEEYKIDYLIWMHGETDSALFKKLDIDQGPAFFQKYGKNKFYYEAFKIMYSNLNKYFNKKIQIILTSSTICNSSSARFINDQQNLIANLGDNFHIINETDSLDDSYRYDGCHLNKKGVDVTAKSIADIINTHENFF